LLVGRLPALQQARHRRNICPVGSEQIILTIIINLTIPDIGKVLGRYSFEPTTHFYSEGAKEWIPRYCGQVLVCSIFNARSAYIGYHLSGGPRAQRQRVDLARPAVTRSGTSGTPEAGRGSSYHEAAQKEATATKDANANISNHTRRRPSGGQGKLSISTKGRPKPNRQSQRIKSII
jgi:hypothetical protein